MSEKNQTFPTNRVEVFFDLLKHHKFELLKANLWFLLFAVLSFGALYFYFIYSSAIQAAVINGSATLPTFPNGEAMTIDEYLLWFRTVVLTGMIFTNILFFLGLGGLQHVIQSLIFADLIDKIRVLFFEGVKRNAKQYIGLSLVFSIGIDFAQFIISFYLLYGLDIVGIICVVLAGILIILLYHLAPFVFATSNLYKCGFFSLIKNSYGLYFAKWLRNIPLTWLVTLPVALFLIPSAYFVSIYFFIFIFLYVPITLIIMTLSFNDVSDEKINKEQFPEIYRKGIYDKKEQ